jgi:hypothetical protein
MILSLLTMEHEKHQASSLLSTTTTAHTKI